MRGTVITVRGNQKALDLFSRKQIRFWYRLFVIRCCLSCKHFNVKTVSCRAEPKVPLGKWFGDSTIIKREIGSGCYKWEL